MSLVKTLTMEETRSINLEVLLNFGRLIPPFAVVKYRIPIPTSRIVTAEFISSQKKTMALLTNAIATHILTSPLLPADLGHDRPAFRYCITAKSCLLLAFFRSQFLSDFLRLNYSATTLGAFTLILPILSYPFFPVFAKRFILPETIITLSSLQFWVFQLLNVLLRCLSGHSDGNGLVIGNKTLHALGFAWWMMPLTEFLGITYWAYRRLIVEVTTPPRRRAAPGPQGRKPQKKSHNHEILNADLERQPLLERGEDSDMVRYSDLEKGDGGNGKGLNNKTDKHIEETATEMSIGERMAWTIKSWGLNRRRDYSQGPPADYSCWIAFLLLAGDMAIVRPLIRFCHWGIALLVSAFNNTGHSHGFPDYSNWVILLAKAFPIAVCFFIYASMFVWILVLNRQCKFWHGQGIWVTFCRWVQSWCVWAYVWFYTLVVKNAVRVRALGVWILFGFGEGEPQGLGTPGVPHWGPAAVCIITYGVFAFLTMVIDVKLFRMMSA